MALKPSPTAWGPAGARPGELMVAPVAASPEQHSPGIGRGREDLARTWLKEQAEPSYLQGEEITLTFTGMNVSMLGEAAGFFRGKDKLV